MAIRKKIGRYGKQKHYLDKPAIILLKKELVILMSPLDFPGNIKRNQIIRQMVKT